MSMKSSEKVGETFPFKMHEFIFRSVEHEKVCETHWYIFRVVEHEKFVSVLRRSSTKI